MIPSVALLCASLVIAGCANAFAADDAEQANEARKFDAGPRVSEHASTSGVETLRPIVKVSDYVGKTVVNAHNEELGEITELAIDAAQGRVIYAVLASGGLLGIGQDLYAIPIGAIRQNTADDVLVLATSQARFDEHYAFNDAEWPGEANHDLLQRTSMDAAHPSQRAKPLRNSPPMRSVPHEEPTR